jgi:hypothetical protein
MHSFGAIFAVLVGLTCMSCKTIQTQTDAELKELPMQTIEKIEADGRQPVRINGKVYSINNSNKTELMENGKIMQNSAGLNVEFAKKIFAYDAPSDSGDSKRLLVWFNKAQVGTVTGHEEGVYVYDPDRFNKWDKFNDSYLDTYSNREGDEATFHRLVDVTIHKDQLLALQANYVDKGRVVRNENSMVFFKGSLAETPIDFSPIRFLHEENRLYIIGRKKDTLNQYLLEDPTLPPVWVKTLGESNVNIQNK